MKNKNSGFSLFTVLITVSFLSIMGLLLLYISVANFQMQTTDLKGKDSFYTAEQALEEIRTGLQEYVGEAMSEAYLYVMESYNVEGSTDETLDDLRHAAFTQKYLEVLTGKLTDTETTVTPTPTSATQEKTYSLDRLTALVDLEIDETSETLVITNPTGTSPKMEVGTESGVLLKNIKVIYVDERGRSSIIQTDIRLGIPNIEFPTPSTLPDLMNMIVVADGGIHVKGVNSAKGTVKINGSVYAGLMDKDDDTTNDSISILVDSNQELIISSGDQVIQVVCEGEIKIKEGSIKVSDDSESNEGSSSQDSRSETKENDGTQDSGSASNEDGTQASESTTEKKVQYWASKLTVNEGVNLWASGITLSQATVKLLGKTYIADDLTVESGTGSMVTISGEYYGFGSPDSAKASHNNYNGDTGLDPETGESGVLASRSDASLSSSIIINGKDTTMDLSGVSKLMLAGNSYVGGSMVPTVNDTYQNSSAADVLMGESLTVKGTQVMYLLPAELLKMPSEEDTDTSTETLTLTNPMSYAEYVNYGISACVNNKYDSESGTRTKEATGTTSAFVRMTTKVDAWGGKSLTDIGVDTENPVKAVFYSDNSSGGYVYFYLNFKDESKAAEFMQICFQQEDVKSLMNQYLSFYFPNTGSSGIKLKGSDTYLSLITAGNYLINGNVVTYDNDTDSGNLLEGSGGSTSTSIFATQKGYQNMWFALNRKMIGSYDLLDTEVKDSDGNTHDETDARRSVFDNLVNKDAMVEFVNGNENNTDGSINKTNENGQQYWFVDSGSPKAVFANNGYEKVTVESKAEDGTITSKDYLGYGKELVIDSTLASTLRLVVCTGDVRIESGVNFKGIIMAEGKITLEAGAFLESEPTEAAQVFQAQMAAESATLQVAPRDFFWDGEDYVLGSSSSSSSGSSSSSETDTYDISEAITYENWKKM